MLALAALSIGAGSIVPSQAQTAYASRTTTITGSFTVGSTTLYLKAETRLRAVASMTPPDPFSLGVNPAEDSTTLMVCSAATCLPTTRLCFTRNVTVEDEATGQGALHILSSDATCTVDVTATVSSPKTPVLGVGKIESTSSAVFETGSIIQGSTAVGTDGRVVRAINWGAA